MKKELYKKFYEILYCDEHFTGHIAFNKIQKLINQYGLEKQTVKDFFENPEKYLGRYDGLSSKNRESLKADADFYLKEKNFFSTPLVKNIARGFVFNLSGKIISHGWKLKDKKKVLLGKALISTGRLMILQLNKLGLMITNSMRMNAFYSAPMVLWLFKYFNINPEKILFEYVNGIPVNPYHSPVFKFHQKKIEGCAMIGIDMLQSNNKLFFIEANSNAGHYFERHQLHSNGDPVCRYLVEWASEQGFSELMFYPNNFGDSFDKKLEKAWQEIASEKKIFLTIVDDPYIGSSNKRLKSRFILPQKRGTLLINGRYLHSPFASLVGVKGKLEKEIAKFNKKVNPLDQIFFPAEIDCAEGENIDVIYEDFPNIIVKDRYVDQAKGIKLFKVNSVSDIGFDDNFCIYNFQKPDLVEKIETGEKFVYIYRCYLLVTSSGPVYLGARKDVSSTPLPDKIEYGEVDDISPFIANIQSGDSCITHSMSEDEKCRKEVMKIGKLLYEYVRKKYQLNFTGF